MTSAVNALWHQQPVLTLCHKSYLLTDSIAHGMIVGGSNDPFSLFEAAKGLNDSNIFRKDKGLHETVNMPCSLTFVSRGITDRVDQLDMISSVMPTDIPRNFKPVADKGNDQTAVKRAYGISHWSSD